MSKPNRDPFDLENLTVSDEVRALAQVPAKIRNRRERFIMFPMTWYEALNGAPAAWLRGNRAFIDDLREQFLRWRSLPLETVEHYHAIAERALFGEGRIHAA